MKRRFSRCCCVLGVAISLGVRADVDTNEYDHVVHPGAADGSGFWNKNAKWFMYAPAFAFKPVAGAKAYRFTVVDDLHETRTFTARAPTDSLAPIWGKLPTGFVTTTCEGVGADGRVVGPAGERTFWKSAGFDEGSCPKAAKPYREAAIGVYDYVFNMKETRYLLENGRPDPGYDLNAYVSKMMAALVKVMVRYGGLVPEKRTAAFAVARAAADHLIAKSEPADAPLAFFPPTYDGRGEKETAAGERYKGQVMLVYPAQAAMAFLDLAKATGETRYREAAERIAATYLKLQGEDGTWFLKMTAADGKGVGTNRLVPIQCATPMFERLFAETGKPEYRKAADRSFASVERRLSDWNWEGQFEDVAPTARYENLTKHDACSTAIHLAGRYPDDPARRSQVRELLRFAEDQFVCWEPPFRNGRMPSATRGKLWSGDYDAWVTPCALEQYNCYWPIDASAAKMIRTYLAAYRLEGRREDLAKARALGDAATRMQCDDGRIPTWWWPARAKLIHADWINCMMATAEALLQLDETCPPRECSAPSSLRFGVVSDLHVNGGKTCDAETLAKSVEPLERALRWFDAQGVDAVLVPGDLADMARVPELKAVADTWYRVFPGGKGADGRPVEQLFVFGNHDSWAHLAKDVPAVWPNRAKVWEGLFHEPYADVRVKTVKGHDFVLCGWGSEGSAAYEAAVAAAAAKGRTFFVAQHPHPRGTCHGNFAWGRDAGGSTKVLSACPNAVVFSGHSHYSFSDERTVWQQSFTSIGAGSLRYSGEPYDDYPPVGAENTDVASDVTGELPFAPGVAQAVNAAKIMGQHAGTNLSQGQQGLLVDVHADGLVVRRHEFFFGEDLGSEWKVPLPAKAGGPYDPAKRAASMPMCEFAEGGTLSLKPGKAATRDGVTHEVLFVTVPAGGATTGSPLVGYDVGFLRGETFVHLQYVVAADFNLPAGHKHRTMTFPVRADRLPPDARIAVRPLDCFVRAGRPLREG